MADPSELRTETVRVDPTALPPPLAGEDVKQTVRIQLPVREPVTKPQPFSTPEIPDLPTSPNPLNIIESGDKTPITISWILLGVAALILLIQIWIYLS